MPSGLPARSSAARLCVSFRRFARFPSTQKDDRQPASRGRLTFGPSASPARPRHRRRLGRPRCRERGRRSAGGLRGAIAGRGSNDRQQRGSEIPLDTRLRCWSAGDDPPDAGGRPGASPPIWDRSTRRPWFYEARLLLVLFTSAWRVPASPPRIRRKARPHSVSPSSFTLSITTTVVDGGNAPPPPPPFIGKENDRSATTPTTAAPSSWIRGAELQRRLRSLRSELVRFQRR